MKIIEAVEYNKKDVAIINMIAEQLSVDVSKITYKSNFADDLGADSLDQIELIMAFEELLDCKVPNTEAEKMLTVKDCLDYCEINVK